jgi:transcriptional antiterminator RfaH
MRHWCVVHTQPNSETRALLNISRQGFESYLPLYAKQRRHARKLERVKRPLFPNYLFVRLDPTLDRWRAINGTFGVRYLVAHETAPLPVPEGVVESIQARADGTGLIELDAPRFMPGQRVEILDGPMAMNVGLFQQMTDDQRVVLLLDMLGRRVRVILPSAGVSAA